MKKLIIFFMLISSMASGQTNPDAKRDYTWVFGHHYPSSIYGGSVMNFSTIPATIDTFSHQLHLTNNCGLMCDTAGQLLFFTDAMQVADRTGNLMPNGDSINFGDIWIYEQSISLPTYWLYDGTIILPKPSSSFTNEYYILSERQNYNSKWYIDILYYNIVNMNENSGSGDVVLKNQPIILDTNLDYGGLAACRHANGRDWWILIPCDKGSAYYRILLDPEGIHLQEKQVIRQPSASASFEWSTAIFSNNGDIYIRRGWINFSTSEEINVFSFNRNDGLLSNYRQFWMNDSLFDNFGIAISPNDHYLYYPDDRYLYQFDLWAPDIGASKQIVGVYDGFLCWGSFPTEFGFIRSGPDGKIYLTANNTFYLHTINNPDIGGVGCNVTQRSITLPRVNVSTLPNLPNFRLGNPLGINDHPLLHTITKVKAVPNPASDNIRFEMDISNNIKPMEFQIADITGRIIDRQYVAPFQGIINSDVSLFAEGIYFGILRYENTVIAREKFVVER